MSNLFRVYLYGEFAYWAEYGTGKRVEPDCGVFNEEEYIAELHAEADRSDSVSKCYFIGGTEGAVKIGHSLSPKDRLRTLQLSSPIKLEILAVCAGGADRESAYHWQFMEHRLHGEWFERCPEIEAEIARLILPTKTGDQQS